MTYIALGIVLLIVSLILIIADKRATYSRFMSSFSNKGFKQLRIGLPIIAILAIGYGIFHLITYQPPYLDIYVEEGEYTVFGEIGEVGYYAPQLIKKKEEASIHLVFWEPVEIGDNTKLQVTYPSGKSEELDVTLTPIRETNLKHNIQSIYEVSPISFSEKGVADVTIISGNKTIENMEMEIH
ncbi:hypothetical protein [Radiobacillus deserti]|uniref:Uncharacterized protein n=1 Tax=Radiobacillus deserti TaxID=2594883 RepID=A0A516KC52_9BACI|nr:hypothetical protein [Radiobacillus deserti]QDP39003.1 hypothetical protein FN924_01500 [Radiobacillus deserti]